MVMQIRRTPTPNNPPPAGSLAEGQLSVGMADNPPTLWAGVPTTIDVSGRLQILPGNFVTTPTLNGYLPLTAGSAAPLTGDLYFNQAATIANTTGAFYLAPAPGFPFVVNASGGSATINNTFGSIQLVCSGTGGTAFVRLQSAREIQLTAPQVQLSGGLNVGAPTGAAGTTAGSVNVSNGFYVNGVKLTLDDGVF